MCILYLYFSWELQTHSILTEVLRGLVWRMKIYSLRHSKTVQNCIRFWKSGQHMMVFLLGFKLSPESSTHMSVVWPPHSCALVQAIRPLGTSLLKGWEDTSAPLMAARSNRWAPNSPLNKQRRHCVEKQHSSNNKNMNKKQQQIGSKDQWGGTNENIHVNCASIIIVADYLVNHFLDIHHLLAHLVGPKVLQGEQLWEQIIV